MIDRRGFVRTTLAGLALPLVLSCADGDKIRRIGWLSPSARPDDAEIDKDWAALRQLGWIEGRNIVVERRFTADRGAPLDAAAQELVRLKVDLIVTDGTPAALAAKRATATIPIVMASAGDPVALGLVASLAHPGGNITGYSFAYPEVSAKRAALLKELLPSLQRVALPVFPGNPIAELTVKRAEAAYRSLGVRANGDLGKGQDLIFVLRTARLDRVSVTSRTLRRTNLFYSDRTDRASRITWRHDSNST